MKRLISAILAVLMILSLCACGQSGPTWQEQYDLGIKYLEEGNYEEAILAFTAAIEIDPKQADAYIGLADAYTGAGDLDAAKKALEDGLAACGADADLQTKLDELAATPQGEFARYYTTDLLRAEELTIGGVPFWQTSIETLMALYPNGEFVPHDDEIIEWDAYLEDTGSRYWSLHAHADENGLLTGIYYTSYLAAGKRVGFSPEMRGLYCGQNIREALAALGLTQIFIDSIIDANWTSIEINNGSIVSIEYEEFHNERQTVAFSVWSEDRMLVHLYICFQETQVIGFDFY